MSLQTTTWQTVGPFFSIGLERLFSTDAAGEGAHGQRIRIEGRLLDGNGAPIPDAVAEIWQANSAGKYAHPADQQDKPLEQGFRGFARVPTDDEGYFRFTTIRPGSVPANDGSDQAPHLVVGLLMRGLLRGLATRAYFAGDPLNASDEILTQISEPRRQTLLMHPTQQDPNHYTWTIHMQGPQETVILDF